MSIRQIATTVGTVSPSAGDVADFGADLLQTIIETTLSSSFLQIAYS